MMLSDDCYALTTKAAERARRHGDGAGDGWGNFAVSMVTGWQDTVASIVGF